MLTQRIELYIGGDSHGTEHGLIVTGMPFDDNESLSAATSGTLLAHDALEHLNGPHCIGDVLDELEAIGALYFVRGDDWSLAWPGPQVPTRSPEQRLAYDVTSCWEDAEYQTIIYEGAAPDVPTEWQHEGLKKIIELFRAGMSHGSDPEDEEDAVFIERLNAFCEEAGHRLRAGWHKAEQKYGDRITAHRIFCDVRDVASEILKRELLYDGRMFAIDIVQGQVSLVDYDEEERKFECQNCAARWTWDDLETVTDISERVEPGEPMPAGQCPDCGAVCHERS